MCHGGTGGVFKGGEAGGVAVQNSGVGDGGEGHCGSRSWLW